MSKLTNIDLDVGKSIEVEISEGTDNSSEKADIIRDECISKGVDMKAKKAIAVFADLAAELHDLLGKVDQESTT